MKRRLWLFAFALAACAPFALAPKPAAADATCYTNASTYATAAAGLLYFYPLCSASGAEIVSTGAATTASQGDAVSNATASTYASDFNYGYNGSTWDRLRTTSSNNPGVLTTSNCDPVAALRCAIVNATGGDNFGPSQYMLGVQNIPFLFNGTTSDRQRDTTQFGAPANQLGVATAGSICNASVAVNAVSAITQLVALSGTTRVYVCSYSLSVATTSGVGTLQFSYGTGTTCGTGTGNLTGPISLVASTRTT
jgi:hypothetical protein